MRLRTLIALLAVNVLGLWCADRLLAHPGHGTTPAESPVHVVAEPIHSWPILLAVGVGILLLLRRRSRA